MVLTQDSSTYIEESMSTLGWNLGLGIVLVSLILWYFMGLRNAGLVTGVVANDSLVLLDFINRR